MQTMIEVPATEANNYSRILTLLGMEEEGDPVAEVARLKAEREPVLFVSKECAEWLAGQRIYDMKLQVHGHTYAFGADVVPLYAV